MKTIRFNTIEEVQEAIDNFNSLLNFPDEKSDTITYCNIPEPVQVLGDDGQVIESYYEIPITSELELLLNQVGEQNEKDITQIDNIE